MKFLKSIFSLVFLIIGFSVPVQATLVSFPIKSMFGSTNYVKPFTVTAVASSITDNTNYFVGTTTMVTPTGGTNPFVDLTPNNYVVQFTDTRAPWRIQVTNSATVLNALQLTIGTLPTFNYVPVIGSADLTGIVHTGGTTTLLVTNMSVVSAAFTYVTNGQNNYIVVGTFPSFAGGYISNVLYGFPGTTNVDDGRGLTPHTPPYLAISLDGGTTWNNRGSTNSTCKVAVFLREPCWWTNVVIRGYVNNSVVGATNDLTDQNTFVSQLTTNANQVVNLAGAQTIATAAAGQWSTYPAVSGVDLNQKPLTMSPNWAASVETNTLALSFNFNGSPAFRYVPAASAVSGGMMTQIGGFTVTATNLQFSGSTTNTNSPNIWMTANLNPPVWIQRTTLTNYMTGTNWHVWTDKPTNSFAFFRASYSTNNAPARFEVGDIAISADTSTNYIYFAYLTDPSASLPAGVLTNGSPLAAASLTGIASLTNLPYKADGSIWQAMPIAPVYLACSQLIDGYYSATYTTTNICTNTAIVLRMLTNLANTGWTATMTNQGTPLWVALDAHGSLTINSSGKLDYNTNFFLNGPSNFIATCHAMGWMVSHGMYVNSELSQNNPATNTWYCAYNGSGLAAKATSTLTDPSHFYGQAPNFYTPVMTLAEIPDHIKQFYDWGFDGICMNDGGVTGKSYVEIQNAVAFNVIYPKNSQGNVQSWKYNYYGRKPMFVIPYETMGQGTNLYSTPDLVATRNGFLTDQGPQVNGIYGNVLYSLGQLRYAQDNYPLTVKCNNGMLVPVGSGGGVDTVNATASALASMPTGVWPDVVNVPDSFNLLTNKYWNRIHNDPLQLWPRWAVDGGPNRYAVLAKPLVDGSTAVGVFCDMPAGGTNITATWQQLGLVSGAWYNIYDVWNNSNLGNVQTNYAVSIGAAQARLLIFTPTNLLASIPPGNVMTNGQPFLTAFTDASDWLTYSNGFGWFRSLGASATNFLFDFKTGQGIKLNFSGATYYLGQDNNQGNGYLTSNYRPGSGVLDENQSSWFMAWGYSDDSVRWFRAPANGAGGAASFVQLFRMDNNGSVTIAGTNTAAVFKGNGNALTNLDATKLTGTIPSALLPTVLTNLNNINSGSTPTVTILDNHWRLDSITGTDGNHLITLSITNTVAAGTEITVATVNYSKAYPANPLVALTWANVKSARMSEIAGGTCASIFTTTNYSIVYYGVASIGGFNVAGTNQIYVGRAMQ